MHTFSAYRLYAIPIPSVVSVHSSNDRLCSGLFLISGLIENAQYSIPRQGTTRSNSKQETNSKRVRYVGPFRLEGQVTQV